MVRSRSCCRVQMSSVDILMVDILMEKLLHRNKWNIEMVLHCESAAIVIASPTATQSVINSDLRSSMQLRRFVLWWKKYQSTVDEVNRTKLSIAWP